MPETTTSARRTSRARLIALVGAAMAVLLLAGGAGMTMAWGDSLRDEQRLLPGTTIAGVDVGAQTVADAVADLRAQVADALDRPIEVTHGQRSWSTTPRALEATSDVEQVAAAAFEATTEASLVHLLRLRLGAGAAGVHDVVLDVPDDAVATFVAGIADAVDTPPRDAVLTWVEGSVVVDDAVTGLRVGREDAAAALEEAIAQEAGTLALPVQERAPAFATEPAHRVADEVSAAVDVALDHRVTVTLEDTSRTVAPRGLGATHNGQDLLDARGATPDDVVLEVPDDAVAQLVAEVAAGHEVASRDASLDWAAAGGFAATPGSTGLAVDREAARAAVHQALQGEADRVVLELATTQPDITTDSFGEVLLVRQAERRVELYRGGQAVRSWPVAVGTSGYRTPTGMFTIGAKRHRPTWVNSSPDGWGSDMPARIGPGPDNPLGVRALNWMRDGRDTLIRFHGTANEASIGQAASHGCVRMLNRDVVELYDLVGSGTVIVSVDG